MHTSFFFFGICFSLCHFNHNVPRCGALWVHIIGTLCASLTWITVSCPRLGEFSTIISSNKFIAPFFSSFSFWDPIMQMLVRVILSQRSLEVLSLKNIFFLFSLGIFPYSVFQPTDHFFFCIV